MNVIGWRVVAIVLAALQMGGCAIIQESVDIKYQPVQAASSAGPDSAGVTLEVKGSDSRIANRDRVATKKNGYGVELAKITSTKNVVELVRSSVEKELKNQGCTIAPGGAVVTAEVLTFYSDFKPMFLAPVADSASEVSFNLKVLAADGSYIYGRTYRGMGSDQDVLIMTPGGARVSLEQALTAAMQEMVQDQTLMAALTAKAPSSAVKALPARSPMPAVVASSIPISTPVSAQTGAPTPAATVPDPAMGQSRSRL